MKALVFDSSTVINLALNNLLWILEPLKKKFGGEFYITPDVKKEVIDTPFQMKRFKLESMQISNEINKGNLKIYTENITEEINEFKIIANELLTVKKQPLKLVDIGEISSLVVARKINAEALVVDERTTKLLIESPETLANIFKEKLHEEVTIDLSKLKVLKQKYSQIKVIRSTELGVVAYEMGILNNYLPQGNKKEILDAVLWGLRLKGCAISEKEMQEIMSLEK